MIKSIGKIQKSILFTIVGLIIIILIIAYLIYKNHSVKPAANTIVTNTEQPATTEIGEEPDVTPPEDEGGVAPTSATDYYSQGFIKFQNQHYTEAISDFDNAIALNPSNDIYYAKKSEAQYNLGQKEAAIKTVEDGLKVLPDSDLLKTKLDILNKEWFGNQPQ